MRSFDRGLTRMEVRQTLRSAPSVQSPNPPPVFSHEVTQRDTKKKRVSEPSQ